MENRKMKSRGTWMLAAGVGAAMLVPSAASAYSTKLHMITGYHIADILRKNNCKLKVGGWKNSVPGLNLNTNVPGLEGVGDKSYDVDLSGEICNLITSPATTQYFVSGTTGPDTFQGMFGNTDPTHALLWNTSWQITLLWQNAKTPQEKAFVLGWVVHFAGDLNAHSLANMHAKGVWMAGGDTGTVWKHLVSETYYAMSLVPYPKGFDNRLVWPQSFVKKMFYNPAGPLYQHTDYLWNRYVGTEDIGLVAKIFGGINRGVFLLWDMHARDTNRWNGRKNYFIPRKNKSISEWLHWAFADQAWNYNKKKEAAARVAIDKWILATHRAQQAAVADKNAIFTGAKDKGYAKEEAGRPPKKNFYKSGGVGGIADAYEFWFREGIWPLLSPDLITITNENFPLLFQIMETIKKMGSVLAFMADAVKEGFKALIKVLTYPLTLILDAIKAAVQPMIDEFKAYLKEEAMCNPKSPTGMPEMCKTIDAQKAAFKIQPGNITTYLNWPIYRNTITVGALMLEKMKTLDKDHGDETASPLFGLPSGDFGCTMECTGVYQKQAAIFMPVAGKFYQDPAIRAAFPDYCVGRRGADGKTDRRRNEAINESFAGKSNNEANIIDTKPAPGKEQVAGFTCFASGKGDLPKNCASDAYAEPAKGIFGKPAASGGSFAERMKVRFLELMGDFYARVGGRWDYHQHIGAVSAENFVMPPDGANMKREFTYMPKGVESTTSSAPARVERPSRVKPAFGSSSAVTTARPANVMSAATWTTPNRIFYRRTETTPTRSPRSPTTQPSTTADAAPYCYRALAYGDKTLATDMPTPLNDHKALDKVESYDLKYFIGNALSPILKFLSGSLTDAFNALKQAVCKFVDEKVQMAYDAVIGTPAGKICADAYCKLASTEIPMSRPCKQVCAPKFLGGGCKTVCSPVDVPGTPRINQQKYRSCVDSKCKQWTTKKVKICK